MHARPFVIAALTTTAACWPVTTTTPPDYTYMITSMANFGGTLATDASDSGHVAVSTIGDPTFTLDGSVDDAAAPIGTPDGETCTFGASGGATTNDASALMIQITCPSSSLCVKADTDVRQLVAGQTTPLTTCIGSVSPSQLVVVSRDGYLSDTQPNGVSADFQLGFQIAFQGSDDQGDEVSLTAQGLLTPANFQAGQSSTSTGPETPLACNARPRRKDNGDYTWILGALAVLAIVHRRQSSKR
jgi:hypothetical protein